MRYLIADAKVYINGHFKNADVLVTDGVVSAVRSEISPDLADVVFNFPNHLIIPGLIDVHVHFREPGFLYKEDISTGSMAAAHGGYTHVCTMPNLDPVPDTADNLSLQLKAIEKKAVINVYPYGAITYGEKGEQLADMAGMAEHAIAFSDDGRGVPTAELMKAAMLEATRLGKMIVAHCEDMALVNGGYIHDGEYAKAHGHRGICSESEWAPIKRDIELLRETGAAYHVCHVSTKESVELIRAAKAEGLNITAETAPHYLVLTDADLKEDARFKMNPPLRSAEDRDALLEGVLDGTIDMIATDHAPHSAEEKGRGLEKSLMGVVGLETAFGVMYTHLVKTGKMSLEKLVEIMHDAPMKRFGIGRDIAEGEKADFAVLNITDKYTVDPEKFLTKGRSTPFAGAELYGECRMTVTDGRIVWQQTEK